EAPRRAARRARHRREPSRRRSGVHHHAAGRLSTGGWVRRVSYPPHRLAGPGYGTTVIVRLVALRVEPLFRNSRRSYVPGVEGIVTENDAFASPLSGGV